MTRTRTFVLLVGLCALVGGAVAQLTAQGPQRQRFTYDTGVVMVAPNQKLRVVISRAMGKGDPWQWRRMVRSYVSQCSDGDCRLEPAGQQVSSPMTMTADEAASFEVPGTADGARIVLQTTTRDARVSVSIVDRASGDVVSVLVFNENEPLSEGTWEF